MSAVIESERDCPTCAHHLPADCGSPVYRELDHEGQKAFWRRENVDPPCPPWEQAKDGQV